jgi:hypothetical protein
MAATRSTDAVNSNRKTARIAGLLYLIVVVAGIFSLLYVPSRISVPGDTAATVSNILAHQTLYGLGIVVGCIGFTAFLILPLVLYELLSPVAKNAAALMVAFAVVSAPISFISLVHKFDVLSLLTGADYAQAMSSAQLQAQIRLSLDAYRNGMLVSQIFWGLWLFPFGYLVFKSGFLPRILGILLMLGCVGYLITFLGTVLYPGYADTAVASYVSLPGSIGEIGICLWLLIVGVRHSNSPAVSVLQEAS